MNKNRPSPALGARSWLDRLGQALLGEVSDRDQLRQLLRDAHRREVLEQEILHMMEGALRMAELRVRDVMVPRAQMVSIQRDETISEFLPRVIEAAHSRYPVVGEDRGVVVGILLAKDLLHHCFAHKQNEPFDLRKLLRPAVFVPQSKRLNVLLNELRATRNHMAIVVDEFGAAEGLITIEDILEEIVGEIEDEHDLEEREEYIFKRGNACYSVKALTPIAAFNAYFTTDLQDDTAETIGGLVANHLGHLPQQGERVQVGVFEFEVMHADKRRVYLLAVQQLSPNDTAED